MKTYQSDDFLGGSSDGDVWANGPKKWRNVSDGLSLHKISKDEIVKKWGEVLFIYGKNGAEDEATSRQKQSQ